MSWLAFEGAMISVYRYQMPWLHYQHILTAWEQYARFHLWTVGHLLLQVVLGTGMAVVSALDMAVQGHGRGTLEAAHHGPGAEMPSVASTRPSSASFGGTSHRRAALVRHPERQDWQHGRLGWLGWLDRLDVEG